MTEVKSIFDYLQILLRYLVSGIISVLVIAYLDNSCYNFLVNLFSKSPWLILALSGTFGIITYAIHQALLDKLLYRLSLFFYLTRHKVPEKLKNQIETSLNVTRRKTPGVRASEKIKNLRFGLFTQSYLRKCSERNEIICIQREMDKKLALLNFLYCTFYSTFIFTILNYIIYHFIHGHQVNAQIHQYGFHKFRMCGILFLSLVIFISAIYFDFRITKRELWTVEFFFQELPVKRHLVEFKLPKLGTETSAYIIGSFDNWTTKRSMMQENNIWVFRTEIFQGEIRYKYFVNEYEITNNPKESMFWDSENLFFKRQISSA